MAKWSPLPTPKLLHNPYQAAFWAARRGRICRSCNLEFESGTTAECPTCKQIGLRKFNRLLLLSGRRGGKTKAASIAAVEEACIPNSIVWCTAPTAPKLHRYVLPALQELIPNNWVKSWNIEFLDLRLRNNSLIHCQTLEDPDQGRGQGLDAVWLDEAAELTLKHWEVIRPSLTERRGVAIFSSTPRGFDWVYDKFYLPAEQSVPGYWACRYATIDNPIISAEEIAEAKATMSDEMYRQEFEADFVVFQGAVYGGAVDPQVLRTDDDVRKIIPEWPQISSDRQILVGLDTGADHPFGATKIVATESGLVVVGEYLERHRSFVEHAASIKAMTFSHGFGPVRYAINKNERQPMIELAQHGIFCERAQNDQVAGTERVKSWLHAHQLFFVEQLVPRTITQMKSLRWADNYSPKDESKTVKEKVYKKADELPDCVRYSLVTFPQLPSVKPASTERDISKLPAEMQSAILRNRRIDKDPALLEANESQTLDFWA